ncbi:MAG TPA: hypothetical protein VGQ93_10815 [Lysobacter sp.]|jgi:hypothetical protein|nr:hypothetical protein [Lysobacter sp.]
MAKAAPRGVSILAEKRRFERPVLAVSPGDRSRGIDKKAEAVSFAVSSAYRGPLLYTLLGFAKSPAIVGFCNLDEA